MQNFVDLITYLFTVSVAAERVVDIIKRSVFVKYNIQSTNGAVYQLLAALFGGIIAYIDCPTFDFISTNKSVLICLIALATSGGSGMWNTVLNILKEMSIPKPTN